MSVVLHVRPDRTAPIAEQLRREGVDVVEGVDGGPAHGQVDAAIIDAGLESPVVVARAFHRTQPDAHIVFVTDDENEPRLRRELLFAPRIGTHWSVTREPLVQQTLRGVLSAKSRRENVRSAIDKMNIRMAEASSTPLRRRIPSEQFLATILNQLSDGVVVIDDAGAVEMFNAAAQRMLGPGLRRGATARELFANAPNVIADVSSSRGTEVMLHGQGGEPVFAEVRVTAVTDEAEQRAGKAIVIRDVTWRTRGDLRKQFLAAAAGAFASTLDEGTIVQQVAEVAVAHFADFCIIDLVDEERIERRAVAAVGEQTHVVSEIRRRPPSKTGSHPVAVAIRTGETIVENAASGDKFENFASDQAHLALLTKLAITAYVVAPLGGPNQARGAILLARSREAFDAEDVATIEELARRISSALQNAWLYRAADEANRSKDEFLATVSHELRTPMTSILGWVQLMRIGDLDDEAQQEAMTAIEQSARVQAQLIDDLLDLSRIQMGKLHLETSSVDVASVVNAAVETVRPAANAKDIAIEVELEDGIGEISGDPNRLQQVFWNLLSNAVKFTGKRGRIRVVVDVKQSKARVRVTDSGQGIDPQFVPFVFERFRQADNSITRRFGGLGLGLSIVKQITEMHGGTVEAQSEGLGKGATFTVYLPLLSVRPARAKNDTREPLADLTGVRVLIVDDEASVSKVVGALLAQAGAQVDSCNTSEGALAAIRRRLPDVLISDIAMPDLDGFELIRRVRTVLRITPERLPAIALTALGDVRSRIELLGAGFQRYLRKPVDAAELARTVAEVAARRGGWRS